MTTKSSITKRASVASSRESDRLSAMLTPCEPSSIESTPEFSSDGLTISGFVSPADVAYEEPFDRVEFNFGISRRTILQASARGCLLPYAISRSRPKKKHHQPGARAAVGKAEVLAVADPWPLQLACTSAKTVRLQYSAAKWKVGKDRVRN